MLNFSGVYFETKANQTGGKVLSLYFGTIPPTQDVDSSSPPGILYFRIRNPLFLAYQSPFVGYALGVHGIPPRKFHLATRILTPPKFNMEPENDGFQKESPFPRGHFQVPC